MTYTPASWTCNGCGEPVSEREMLTLSVAVGADVEADDFTPGHYGHWHLDCYDEIHERLWDVVESDTGDAEPDDPAVLERIPVATGYQLRAARRRHRTPDGKPHRFGDADLHAALESAPAQCRHGIFDAGITSLAQVARMSDEQLLALPRVGQKTVDALRRALTAGEDVGTECDQ